MSEFRESPDRPIYERLCSMLSGFFVPYLEGLTKSRYLAKN